MRQLTVSMVIQLCDSVREHAVLAQDLLLFLTADREDSITSPGVLPRLFDELKAIEEECNDFPKTLPCLAWTNEAKARATHVDVRDFVGPK